MNRKIVLSLFLMLLLVLVTPAALLASGKGEAAKKEGTLKFWHGYPEYDVVFKDMAAKDYMVANPGVKVEISSFPLREYERKLAVALPAGTGPDIFFFDLSYTVKFIEAGLVDQPPQRVVDFVKKSFKPAFIQGVTYKDKIWAMAYTGAIKAAFYNTDMYKAAGLDRAPRNWDEVRDYAKKTTKYDAAGNVVRSGVSLRLSGGGSGIAEKFWMWMLPTGSTLAEQGKEFGKYHAGYDNEGGRETLKLYIDLLYKLKADSFNIKHDSEALALEQTAYFQRESWVIGYMKENAPDVKYDTAPLPVIKRKAGMKSNTNMNVSASSKVKDLAWDFALFTEEEKYLKAVIEKVGWLTARADINYDDIFAKEPRFRPFIEITDDYVGVDYPMITTADEIYTKFADKLVPAFQRADLVDNPAGIAKIISDAAKGTNDILKEAGEYGE
ncbi:MAG TPA: extracellular solute-binding protein [Spirochaetia bacterium]|nr:extracellular solute-binding protein [Spirochaetia bacterium]